ncbi:MAG: NAD-dependent epimerase/dehydratase family protein [Actinomycetota bacterium]
MTGNGLTVAITGPTGDIGGALARALEDVPEVAKVRGMARRPFDPYVAGLTKFEYVRGDILDRALVDAFVKEADVVVHLAFLIFGSPQETRSVNLEGSRNVFEASLEAGASRLIYTSSVAAYGFHDDNPELLTEDVGPRGTEDHYYSEQKADLEKMLAEVARGHDTDIYVFRPCIVAGPTALELIRRIPYIQLSDRLPERARKLIGSLPVLRPVIPDPGVPFQLVHEDDVATALVAAILGRGSPGVYNLAADGEISLTDLGHALGWYAVPLPELVLLATVKVVSTLPLLPASTQWLSALKVPVLMDCSKVRRQLGWRPRHDALETLAETIASARDQGLLPWPDRVE